MSAGAKSLVRDAPVLPAPKMPSAVPCNRCGNQADVYAMPTAKVVPAMPMKRPSTRYCQYWVATQRSRSGMAVVARSAVKMGRPPIQSVAMPMGRRRSDPVRMGSATSRANSVSPRESSFRMAIPTMAKITHTANITVNPKVFMARTLLRFHFSDRSMGVLASRASRRCVARRPTR